MRGRCTSAATVGAPSACAGRTAGTGCGATSRTRRPTSRTACARRVSGSIIRSCESAGARAPAQPEQAAEQEDQAGAARGGSRRAQRAAAARLLAVVVVVLVVVAAGRGGGVRQAGRRGSGVRRQVDARDGVTTQARL